MIGMLVITLIGVVVSLSTEQDWYWLFAYAGGGFLMEIFIRLVSSGNDADFSGILGGCFDIADGFSSIGDGFSDIGSSFGDSGSSSCGSCD